jgi:tetratricopeptide (TPR) repeat protein
VYHYAMPFRFLALIAFLALTFVARGAAELDSAIALYQARKFPDARAAFEALVATEPHNAAACYYLGMTLRRRGDDRALDDAIVWLEKAAQLEPNNAKYLADYGGTSLQLAAKHRSVGAATRGRDAMEKSLKLEPNNIEARMGLMQFYQRAPWPLGSGSKAKAQLEAIRQIDPTRALSLEVRLKTDEKDYVTAFRICEDVLAKNPSDYNALYQYGRTASISGENLQRGLELLQRCVALPESGPSAPTHSDVWHRVGAIREKLAQPAEARAAYEAALKLSPGNRAAADALAKLP